MSKMKEILKQVEGDVLGIGLTDSMRDHLRKNKKITDLAFLDNLEFSKKGKITSSKKTKTISIKKLRKVFKKNRVDYTVCNVDQIAKYLKYVVKDTIHFTKKEIYLYFDKNEELAQKLEKMYGRYHVEIKKTSGENVMYFQIINQDKKKNKGKDLYYFWKDTFEEILDFVRAFLSY